MGDKGVHDPQSAIELNPQAAKGRQDIYSSLTDLHGIYVFTDEFRSQVESVDRQQDHEEEELQQSFFVDEASAVQDKDEQVLAQLFTGQEERILNPDYTKNTTGISVVEISMVLIAILAVTAMYLFLFGDRKSRKKKVA